MFKDKLMNFMMAVSTLVAVALLLKHSVLAFLAFVIPACWILYELKKAREENERIDRYVARINDECMRDTYEFGAKNQRSTDI